MHELPVTQSLLDIVKNKAVEINARKVIRINAVVGELSGVEPDCVKFYFDVLKTEYGMDETTLEFTRVPALLTCRDCQQEFHTEEIPWICPQCSGLNLNINKGSECYIESIEVDE